jgi:hypothetical protein
MSLLPSSFSDLEPFATSWCLKSEPERWEQRHASGIEELRKLYDAVFPRVEAIYAYVDRFPLDNLPSEAQNLLYLMFSFVMVSFPVEVWDDPRIPDVDEVTLDRVASPRY